MKKYDTIVIGLGAHGSAALYHLFLKGHKVLGLEAFARNHEKGSSHGETRMIRYSYANGDHFVPMVMRARELWRDLEAKTGQQLLFEESALYIGEEDNKKTQMAIKAAQQYDLEHEILSAPAMHNRFPQFRMPAGTMALHDKEAGYLLSEKCIDAHLALAEEQGAELRFESPVLDIDPAGAGVKVRTAQETFEADKVILTAGAYLKEFAQTAYKQLEICRLVIGWFEPEAKGLFAPDRCPSFVIYEGGDYAYGFPIVGVPGVKIGDNTSKARGYASPEGISRDLQKEDEEALRYWLAKYIPGANQKLVRFSTCLAMETPDENFILGPHPGYPNIILGHACSGHGFKMSAAIGELLADVAKDSKARFDISAHNPARMS